MNICELPELQTAFENMVRIWQKQNMRLETDINELIGRMSNLVSNAEWKSAKPEWIPCEKQMPEPEESVWVCYFGRDLIMPDYKNGETLEECMARIEKIPTVTIGFIGSDGWYGIDGYPLIISPSFWMPLFKPEPPERE